MRWAGAAFSVLLTACATAYRPHITAPAEKTSLQHIVSGALATPDREEEFFVYVPKKGIAYHLEQNPTIGTVAVNTQQYLQIIWNETELFDIHTHPRETSGTANMALAVERSIAQSFDPQWLQDEQFRRFTPSPADIAALVRVTERFNIRKSYNHEKGSIRFFIATEEHENYLTEYALKQQGEQKDIVNEYTGLLTAYRATKRRDYREFQAMVNTQSRYLHLETRALKEAPVQTAHARRSAASEK